MKKIEAIIKPHRLDEAKRRSTPWGSGHDRERRAGDYGRQKGHTEIYRGAEYTVDFVPKVRIEIVVDDDIADQAESAIVTAARTDKIGDGKVFTYDVAGAVASAPASGAPRLVARSGTLSRTALGARRYGQPGSTRHARLAEMTDEAVGNSPGRPRRASPTGGRSSRWADGALVPCFPQVTWTSWCSRTHPRRSSGRSSRLSSTRCGTQG